MTPAPVNYVLTSQVPISSCQLCFPVCQAHFCVLVAKGSRREIIDIDSEQAGSLTLVGQLQSHSHSGRRYVTHPPGACFTSVGLTRAGIGAEIAESVKSIYKAAKVPISWEEVDVTPILKDGKTVIPDDAIKSIKTNTVALKGPLATPSVYSAVS